MQAHCCMSGVSISHRDRSETARHSLNFAVGTQTSLWESHGTGSTSVGRLLYSFG